MGGVLSSATFYEDKRLEKTTDFTHAAQLGDVVGLLSFLALGQSIDATDMYGRTALHYAARHGKLGALKALLESGSAPDTKDSNGRTPLHHACQGGQLKIVQYLLEYCSVNVNAFTSSGDTPLHKAVFRGNADIVAYLLNSGSNINAMNRSLEKPIEAAKKLKAVLTISVKSIQARLNALEGKNPVRKQAPIPDMSSIESFDTGSLVTKFRKKRGTRMNNRRGSLSEGRGSDIYESISITPVRNKRFRGIVRRVIASNRLTVSEVPKLEDVLRIILLLENATIQEEADESARF